MSESAPEESEEGEGNFKYIPTTTRETLRELNLKFADQVAAYPLLLPSSHSDKFLCHVKTVVGDSELKETLFDVSMPIEAAISTFTGMIQLLSAHVNTFRTKEIKVNLSLTNKASLIARVSSVQEALNQLKDDINEVLFDPGDKQ